jgi:hypothetical protein
MNEQIFLWVNRFQNAFIVEKGTSAASVTTLVITKASIHFILE